MNYFPLGDIDEARYELCEKYKLVEYVNGVYRLTQKCRDNYDEISFIKYLKGDLSQPLKKGKETVVQELLAL